MKKRVFGIDIIKLLGIAFVPSLHFFLNFGFNEQPYVGFTRILEVAIRWISFSCIGLFIMSTGYLQCNKTPSMEYYKKITKYLVSYIIYSLVTALIFQGRTDIIKSTMYYFLQYPGYFWYMSFFLGFYMLIPYFNIIVGNIKEEKQFKIFIFVLILLTSIPEFINSIPALISDTKYIYLPGSFTAYFPLTYYFMGAYFRKFQPKKSKKISAGLLLATALCIALIDFKLSNGGVANYVGGGYGSIITVIIAYCIFQIFYDVTLKNIYISKTAGYLSNITLEIYLGYMISDKYTSLIIDKYFSSLKNPFTFKLYLIEFPLNLLIAVLLAVMIKMFISLADWIFIKTKRFYMLQITVTNK